MSASMVRHDPGLVHNVATTRSAGCLHQASWVPATRFAGRKFVTPKDIRLAASGAATEEGDT